MKKLSLSFLIVLFSLSGVSRSTKGKEFWIGFMENLSLMFHSPSFRLHVSADVTTTCTLSVPYTGYTSTFVVTANQVYVFNLPASNFYPLGDEATANNGIRLLASDSVEVKAFHHRTYFTESTLVLPLHEIGSDYFVIAQPDLGGISPSEFVVLATQNNTAVEITPSAVTMGTRPIGVAFTVTLQQGQMYQIQAMGDLTGTLVRSLDPLKKIAVFGGARQAKVGCNNAADDHVYDQLYPTASLGTGYHVIPFSGHLFDVVKVIASQNNTSVSVTGGNTYTLNKGQCATFTINASCEISSTLPVAVAQIATSQDCNGTPGDPGMITLVPLSLSQNKALFYTPASAKPGPIADYFPFHRLNIVIKNSAIGNLRLDNVTVTSSFSLVSVNSNYSYTQLVLDTLASLQHTLVCDSGFNATIYSFASYNFYGHHLGYSYSKQSNATGFRTNKLNSSLSVFPVPTEETLVVKAAKTIGSVSIADLFGKEVLRMPDLASQQISLNVSVLKEGIYYCLVQYEDGTAIQVVKFVKMKKE